MARAILAAAALCLCSEAAAQGSNGLVGGMENKMELAIEVRGLGPGNSGFWGVGVLGHQGCRVL